MHSSEFCFFPSMTLTLQPSSSGHGKPLYITSGDINSTKSKETEITVLKERVAAPGSIALGSRIALETQQDLMAFNNN